MKKLFAAVVGLLSVVPAARAADQVPVDSAQLMQALREDAGAAKELLTQRRQELGRHTRLLGDLVEVAETLSVGPPSMALSDAGKKLQAAAALAEAEPALPEPVPSTLRRVRAVLSRPGAELSRDRTRAELFASLDQLEERLIQLSESAAIEASMYEMVGQTLLSSASSLRAAPLSAVRALIHARRKALD